MTTLFRALLQRLTLLLLVLGIVLFFATLFLVKHFTTLPFVFSPEAATVQISSEQISASLLPQPSDRTMAKGIGETLSKAKENLTHGHIEDGYTTKNHIAKNNNEDGNIQYIERETLFFTGDNSVIKNSSDFPLLLCLLFISFIIITIAIYSIILRKVLKPLHELTEHFPVFFVNNTVDEKAPESFVYSSNDIPLSNIKELRDISLSFNAIQQKFLREFNSQIEETSRLHREAYQDVTTGLANRRWFRQQLDTASHEGVAGVLFIIDLEGLSHYYETISNQDADTISLRIATLLREQCATYPDAIIARTRLAEFAIWCPRLLADPAEQLAKILLANINQVMDEYEEIQSSQSHNGLPIELPVLLGGATTHGRQTSQALLSAADMALQRARKTVKKYYIHQDTFSPVLNNNHSWRSAISDVIESPAQNINAILQPVFDSEGNLLHQEAFIQLKLNEQWIMAEDWLPMVEAVGLSVPLDMAVISYLAQQHADKAVAINISMLSVHSHDFIHYLQQVKFEHQHLILEVSESALLMNIDRAKFFIQHIENSGWRWGLDQFGRVAGKGYYLAQFKPEYIKLDYSYTNSIDTGADIMTRNIVIALCRLIYQCSPYAIATRVESEKQKQQLIQLSLNGFQGFGISVSREDTEKLDRDLSGSQE